MGTRISTIHRPKKILDKAKATSQAYLQIKPNVTFSILLDVCNSLGVTTKTEASALVVSRDAVPLFSTR